MARDTDGIFNTVWASAGDTAEPGFDRSIGWPIEYSQAGGPAPSRSVFNKLFNELYALGVDVNKYGCLLPWDALVPYATGARVIGSNGVAYISADDDNESNDPVGDDGTYWHQPVLRKTLAANGTFVFNYAPELTVFVTTSGAERNYNPSGSFPDGFRLNIINLGTSYSVIIDSTGSAVEVTPGSKNTLIYDATNDVWI